MSAGRGQMTGGERRCIVILAEPPGRIAVLLEHAPDGGLVLGDDAVVTGEARGLLGDHTEAHRVMIAPGDQRSARRRANRGRVDVVIAQTALRDAIVGVGITPPKVLGTPNPESSVMINSTLGASFGGTMRGAHHGFDCRASFLITPPNFASGAGSCLPSMVVVAPGEPGVPVISWACMMDETVITALTRNKLDANVVIAGLVLSGLSNLKRNNLLHRRFVIRFAEVTPRVLPYFPHPQIESWLRKFAGIFLSGISRVVGRDGG